MNLRTVALLAMNANAVGVKFRNYHKVYVYATYETDLKEGDIVIVPNGLEGEGYVDAIVVEPDAEFDVEADIKYRFIAGKLDSTMEDAWNESHENVYKQLRKQQKNMIQERLLKDFDLKAIKYDSGN